MNKDQFNFELIDKYTPEDVIRNALKQIEDATEGYVIGNIDEYNGPICSYTKQVGLAATISALQGKTETIDVNIQEELGEQSEEKHRYEVFLTVRGLEHYKYRMMFVDYGAISYPVTIVLNEMLAITYSRKRNDTFRLDSMKELDNMLDIVINSDTMISFIQKLIDESIRQQNKNVSKPYVENDSAEESHV